MKKHTIMLRNTATIAALLASVSLFGLDLTEDVNIDGTVTIQSTATGATYTFNNDGAGVNPEIPTDLGTLINPIADTTPVYTQIGMNMTSEENTDNTGIIAETNGNLTLLSDQGTTIEFEYVRAVRNDIYNADQPMAGDSAQVQDIGGYIDPDTGVFVELGVLQAAEVWDPAFIGTPLEGQLILDPALVLTPDQEALLVTESDIPGSGGNLQVGGNANVDGVLSVGDVADVEDTLNTHFDLVSQNIDDIADNTSDIGDNATAIQENSDDIDAFALEIIQNQNDIAANADAIADNSDTLDVHFDLVSQNIDDIAANADAIADNSDTLDVHFDLVSQNIDDIAANADAISDNANAIADEAGARQAADAAINDTLDVHFGLVSQNIDDIAANSDAIASNYGMIVENAANIVEEASVRAAADEDLAAGIADNSAAIDNNVDGIANNAANIAEEASVRAAADEDLAAAIAAGDSAEAAARAAADADLADGLDAVNNTLGVHYGLVSANINDIAQNRGMIMKNMENIETNTRGIAMVAALTHTTILPGMENALDVSAAYFEGETGVSISYSRRINENTQINFAAASTTDFEESVVRGGIGWQW